MRHEEAEAGNGAAPRGTLGTVRNAAELLELLSVGPAYQQLTDLAERSGLSVPTVHRLLRSLLAAGLVEQDASSARYGLGSELVRLSERYLDRLPLLRLLSPYLVELRDRTTATVLVAMLVRDTVVYLDRVDGADVGGLFRRASRSAPAIRSAAGRLLLARAGPEAWKQVSDDDGEMPAPEQWHEWSDARYLLAPIADQGREFEVAVPIVAGRGRVTAALVAWGGPPAFTWERLVDDVVPQLERTAALIARVTAGA